MKPITTAAVANAAGRFLLLVAVVIGVSAGVKRAEATTYPQNVPEGWYRASDPLVNADIVIEGRVVSIGEFEQFSHEDVSGKDHEELTHNYAKVIVSISYVLKGEELASATTENFGFWISDSNLRDPYDGHAAQRLNDGDRVVVCLSYAERFLGGRFMVTTARDIWVWQEAKWFEQDRPNRKLFSSQLYRITDSAQLQAVVRSSQLIVAGAIKSVHREDMNLDGTVATVDRVTVKITGVIKGSPSREVLIIMPRDKVFPDWYYRRNPPTMDEIEMVVGDNWVFMLNPGTGGYHINKGSNGMLRRKGDNLTRVNRELWLRYTTSDLVDIAREQQRGH